MEVPLKNYKELPCDSAIPFLGIYSEKSIIQKDTCTSVLIAGPLIIVRTLKQPKCPSTEEWITKLCGTYIQRNITQPWNNAIYSNMDGLSVCHTEWNKSDGKG